MVEFAIASLFFFVMVMGLMDFGRLLQSWATVQHAALEATRYAVTGRTDCDSSQSNRQACIVEAALEATAGRW